MDLLKQTEQYVTELYEKGHQSNLVNFQSLPQWRGWESYH